MTAPWRYSLPWLAGMAMIAAAGWQAARGSNGAFVVLLVTGFAVVWWAASRADRLWRDGA